MDFTRSFDGLSESGKAHYLQIKDSLPLDERKFFEGCVHIPGQMWAAERKLLYDLVRKFRPEIAVEIGTWKGGGSTYFTALALSENAKGLLYTVESCEAFYNEAVQAYKTHLPQLLPYVGFLLGESHTVYPPILEEITQIDMAFFDGGDEPTKVIKEYEMFDPYFHRGSVIAMHDWDSEKMSLMRPYIKQCVCWEKIEEMSLPLSQVGMAAFIHI